MRKHSMALGKFLMLVTVCVIVNGEFNHEIQAENKDKKTLATKGQFERHPEKDRTSIRDLHRKNLNRTADEYEERGIDRPRENRRKGKSNLKVIRDKLNLSDKANRTSSLNDAHESHNDEPILALDERKVSGNESDPLRKKIVDLLRIHGPTYEAVSNDNYETLMTGVYCNFEKSSLKNGTVVDMCAWEWNKTVSSYSNGFGVVSPVDLQEMNRTKGYMINGPLIDADGNESGHFLYLPVDPTMENMAIKSPAFPGFWEFCKFEVMFHQSKMQNASIRIIAESSFSNLSWILQEITGNNVESWARLRFTIGKVQQDVHIIIEIVRPANIDMSQPLPHIAVDNIRMVDCFPEPPEYGGECQLGQLKCKIQNQESCIKLQQVCDLVKDCDGGVDEQQNCDKMPYGSQCNFEQDDCGFKDVPGNVLKWSRHNGPTPTDKTGPNYDHTCGPPETHLPMTVPLSPAFKNFTNQQCVGWYFFVNMNVTGPNEERVEFASTAVMHSTVFNPPPRVHGNITSKYYNCCMIRFYYQQNGRNYGSLGVTVMQITSRGNFSIPLWFSTKDKGEHWYRAAIFLPNITTRYLFEIKTRMGMRIYSDSAIDDFSLAPECFGLNIDPDELGDYNYYDPVYDDASMTPHKAFADKVYYRFNTCGAKGRYGPNQTMCDAAYNSTAVAVTVLNEPPYTGVQSWEVPAEGYYTIIASGASGGLGSAWSGLTQGSQTRALFELHKSEVVYMLVGQQGLNACKKHTPFLLPIGSDISDYALSSQYNSPCPKKQTNVTSQYFSKTQEVKNTVIQDGGGGGGGATYVFLLDKDGQPVPLLVAAGGGGISVGVFHDDGSQHGKGLTDGTPQSGYMYGSPGQTSGAGGGWVVRPGPSTPGFDVVRGSALREGGAGGAACSGEAHGGFGGGGGACTKGGGGGGWIGGNTNQGSHGSGGYSYIDPRRAVKDYSKVSLAQHMSQGEVLIIPAIHDCGCDYRCVALNEFLSEVQCYCPSAWQTDEHDPTKCIMENDWTKVQWTVIVVLSAVVLLCALGLLCGCLYLYNSYQRKKEDDIRRKRLLEQELQLRRLRNTPGGAENALSSFNPHYGCEGMLPQGVDVRGLPQVSRESLKLVKALGQGAFGEVYQGLYKHRTGDTVEMPVAVKTLPEMSTGQSESDFLMEAAIMAKFNHPNVIHLIGVCFDRHPRFIVLELLAGGDLKNFLRENRPRPERSSTLTMKDLLLCALDVAKGCRYMEAKRFIHRDIASRNCLLTSRGPGRVVKIADFGMARDIYRADYYKKGGKALLPIKWMPPEAFIDGVFTIKTDVWSFGVLLWEVFSLGVMPYTGCANREVMELVVNGGRLQNPVGCPQEIYNLMNETWNPNAEERPSFVQMHDRLQLFLQDPEIVGAPLPVMRSILPATEDKSRSLSSQPTQRACDYLVPMTPGRSDEDTNTDCVASSSSTDQLLPHSTSPTAAPQSPDLEASQYQLHQKASLEYGNIPISKGGKALATATEEDGTTSSVGRETGKRTIKFQPSKSTDRLLASAENYSLDKDELPDEETLVWETSFSEPGNKPLRDTGPPVEKLISIDTPQQTPTSTQPPENTLTRSTEKITKGNSTDSSTKNSLLSADRKAAPIASPDPPRINAWKDNSVNKDLKPKANKPLCLDAAQLEQNLNALKKNSGSVNLTTMNILPPYINVVTPNKLSESKTIQIDPKKAVIYDHSPPKEEVKEESKLKTSSSAASLLNGPLTDLPYADSDNASSSSGSNPGNYIEKIQAKSKANNYSEVNIGKAGSDNRNKLIKQGSNGCEFINNDSEISC